MIREGVFAWESGTEFRRSESHVGMPLEFRFGRREGLAEIDSIIFHQNGGFTSTQLDSILARVRIPEATSLALAMISFLAVSTNHRRL